MQLQLGRELATRLSPSSTSRESGQDIAGIASCRRPIAAAGHKAMHRGRAAVERTRRPRQAHSSQSSATRTRSGANTSRSEPRSRTAFPRTAPFFGTRSARFGSSHQGTYPQDSSPHFSQGMAACARCSGLSAGSGGDRKPRSGETGASAACRCAGPTGRSASLGDKTMPTGECTGST
jgi:hypothetical protein